MASNTRREELVKVAQQSALEATQRERARCLWVLDRLLQQCARDLNNKVLAVQQQQLVRLRFELTKTICKAARTLIMTGVRPQAVTLTPAPWQSEPPANPPSEVIVP